MIAEGLETNVLKEFGVLCNEIVVEVWLRGVNKMRAAKVMEWAS